MTEQAKWKPRLAMIVLLASFFVPASIAWTLFFAGWTPGSTGNHGALVEPPHQLDGELVDARGDPVPASVLRGRWSMLLVNQGPCGDTCRARLADLGQVRLALAQNMDRAQIVLLLPEGTPLPDDLAGEHAHLQVHWMRDGILPADDPEADAEISTSLVDTRGYRMMRYEEPLDAYGMLQDIKRLLRLSNIDLERLQGLSEDA